MEFTNSNNLSYTFTSIIPLNEFSMTLPVGTYTLTGSGSARAILEGNSEMVLEINSQTIEITESTTSINVTVTPLVALILVADEDQLINECYISSTSNSLVTEGVLRYAYVVNGGKNVTITKNDGVRLDISLLYIQIGHIYCITVTDAGTTQTIDLNTNFVVEDLVTW